MDAARALQKKLLSKVNATAGMVENEYREGFKSLMSRRMRLNKDTLVHIGEHAKEQLRLARAKDEAELSLALSKLKASRKRVRELLKKYNFFRMEIFANHADLHFVLSHTPQDVSSRDKIRNTLRVLHNQLKTVKLTLRYAARIELEFRANLRDSLAKAELAEIQESGHVQNAVVEDVREQAVEAKLAAIESTNSKADAEGALEKCRKQEALNTIAFDDFKQTGMKLKDAIEDAVEASDALAGTAANDAVYALRRKESDQASDAVALLRKLLESKVAKARNANVAVAKSCALAEFMEMEAATARDEEEDAKADISEAKNIAATKSDKQVVSKASDANDAMERILDAKSHTGMTGVSGETGVSETGSAETGAAETGASERGLGDVQMVPSIDRAHEQSEADEAESAAKKAQQNEKAQEKAEARKEQMKTNATSDLAQLESANQRQANASSTLDEELKGPDAEYVNKSVERIKEDAEAAAVERKLNANVKKVELASEMSQDALMRNLVHSTKDALVADTALHRGPHNATVYSFNVPKSNCMTCKKHKEAMRMSRGAAKASELAEAAGLTSRSIDHRMQVAKMQVELNARRAQTELDEAVASQIKLLEKRVNKSNDKADAALLLKEPAEVNLTEATFTEKEMKAAANIAKAKFVEARSKYQLALKEEENQKAELAKREREWKARIETEKNNVAKTREAVAEKQRDEEKKKS